MAGKKFQQIHLRVDSKTYDQVILLSSKSGDSISEIARALIKKGLGMEYVEESNDIMAKLVRQQVEIVMKPHVERLAKISSKTGHMSSTAAFLNVQALMDLVPKEKRKDVKKMYESARKKAAEYMKTKTTDWNDEF